MDTSKESALGQGPQQVNRNAGEGRPGVSRPDVAQLEDAATAEILQILEGSDESLDQWPDLALPGALTFFNLEAGSDVAATIRLPEIDPSVPEELRSLLLPLEVERRVEPVPVQNPTQERLQEPGMELVATSEEIVQQNIENAQIVDALTDLESPPEVPSPEDFEKPELLQSPSGQPDGSLMEEARKSPEDNIPCAPAQLNHPQATVSSADALPSGDESTASPRQTSDSTLEHLDKDSVAQDAGSGSEAEESSPPKKAKADIPQVAPQAAS